MDCGYPDQKLIKIPVATLLNGFDAAGATYSLTISATDPLVKDLSGNNGPKNIAIPAFVRTAETSTDKAEVDYIVPNTSDPNVVKVVFKGAVDGTTATTASNYTISDNSTTNATVAFQKAPELAPDRKTVTLTLVPGTCTFTGIHTITVKNVKAANGLVMADYVTNAYTLNENVAPTITSARIAGSNSILLTFSEPVQNTVAANAITSVNNTAVVISNGKTYTVASITNNGAACTAGGTYTTLLVTLSENLTVAYGTISITNLKDANGNQIAGTQTAFN